MAQYTDANGQSNEGRYYIVSAPEIHVIASDGSEVKVLLETDAPPVPGGEIDVEVTSDETEEVFVRPVKSTIISNPTEDSEAYFFGVSGQSVHVGPADIVGGGHQVGVFGSSVNNSGTDVFMGIGVEGRYDLMNGSNGLVKGLLGLCTTGSGTEVEELVGVGSEVTTQGVVDNLYGVKSTLVNNTGTIGKLVHFKVPATTGVQGIGTQRLIENDEPTAALVTKGQIVNQSFGYAPVESGGSLQVPPNLDDFTLLPSGTLATLTIALPADPMDGQSFVLSTTQTITALTLSGGVNAIPNPVTTMTAGQSIEYKFIAQGANIWVRKR